MTTWTPVSDSVEEWMGLEYYVWPEGYVDYGYVLPQGQEPTVWESVTDAVEVWA